MGKAHAQFHAIEEDKLVNPSFTISLDKYPRIRELVKRLFKKLMKRDVHIH